MSEAAPAHPQVALRTSTALGRAMVVELYERVDLAMSPVVAVMALDAIDDELAHLRAIVADRRANIIAQVATERSTRAAARMFGISPAAVAKATRRATVNGL